MNRGSASDGAMGHRRSLGFNEAPIHESGKLSDPVIVPAVRAASMRPRFMNRGSGISVAYYATDSGVLQ